MHPHFLPPIQSSTLSPTHPYQTNSSNNPTTMSTQNGSTEQDPVLRSIANTKATYHRLGSSGLRVSNPIFGTMSFGTPEWQPWVLDEEAALPLLKAAYDRGLNTWDTANVYSNGVSEEIIGKAIRKYEIPRNKIVILSKCYGYVGEEPSVRGIMYGQDIAKSKDYVNRGGELLLLLLFLSSLFCFRPRWLSSSIQSAE